MKGDRHRAVADFREFNPAVAIRVGRLARRTRCARRAGAAGGQLQPAACKELRSICSNDAKGQSGQSNVSASSALAPKADLSSDRSKLSEGRALRQNLTASRVFTGH